MFAMSRPTLLRNEITAFIEREGKTHRTWALELGITPVYLAQIMNGERIPALTLAIRMAEETGINIRRFVPDAAQAS